MYLYKTPLHHMFRLLPYTLEIAKLSRDKFRTGFGIVWALKLNRYLVLYMTYIRLWVGDLSWGGFKVTYDDVWIKFKSFSVNIVYFQPRLSEIPFFCFKSKKIPHKLSQHYVYFIILNSFLEFLPHEKNIYLFLGQQIKMIRSFLIVSQSLLFIWIF